MTVADKGRLGIKPIRHLPTGTVTGVLLAHVISSSRVKDCPTYLSTMKPYQLFRDRRPRISLETRVAHSSGKWAERILHRDHEIAVLLLRWDDVLPTAAVGEGAVNQHNARLVCPCVLHDIVPFVCLHIACMCKTGGSD